jgi:hypothetical protein
VITSNQSVAPEDETTDEARMDDAPVTPEPSIPTKLAEPAGPAELSGTAQAHRRPFLRAPRLVIAGAALLLCALVLLLADGGATTAGQSSARTHPTATLAPTATPSPFPTPTAALGFKVYFDRGERFYVQYPLSWEAKQTNPGIQFDDDPNVPNYIVQVLQPGDATTAGSTTDPNDPTVWVRYELNRLASIYQSSFSELPDAAPAMHFGGALWQSGVARLSDNNTNIRVQIFATVYDGTPYIINLLATEDRFADGVRAYFDPMLQSFTFLPSTAS